VFVDIDPKTFNMDSSQVERKVTARTKAIIPVHLFGQCADMDPILQAAKVKAIPVIEDAAQAIGASDRKKRQAGAIGDIGCFSFFPSKNLGAFGDGGMVITNDEHFAETLRVLRVHGGKPKYHHRIVGGNFRLDALQAAVLRVKLKHLTIWTEARRNNASRYRSLFHEEGLLRWATLPEDSPGHIYNQFVVRFPDRDRLQVLLRKNGIETEIYYPVPLHLQQCFEQLGYKVGDFPHAEVASSDSLALPIYPELPVDQQIYVVQKLGEFYR
jgi:dTDP-4-amino-4,6-dideoxygalactose transaminase